MHVININVRNYEKTWDGEHTNNDALDCALNFGWNTPEWKLFSL